MDRAKITDPMQQRRGLRVLACRTDRRGVQGRRIYDVPHSKGTEGWHRQGRIIGFDWTLHQGTAVAVATGRARPANASETLAHKVRGDRVSERRVHQFRAAGQQRVFVDISGRRRSARENDPSSFLRSHAENTTSN